MPQAQMAEPVLQRLFARVCEESHKLLAVIPIPPAGLRHGAIVLPYVFTARRPTALWPIVQFMSL
jgi:hypothetical protein